MKTGGMARDHYDQIAFRCRSLGAATEFSGFRAERLPEQPDPNRNGGGDDGKTDRERRLYDVKGEGAPLILLHELPGLSRQTFALGDLVYDYDQTNPFRRDIRSGQWLDARDLVCQFLRHQMGVS